jgi:hypothetical protein
MPTEYRSADPDVHDLLDDVIDQFFPELSRLDPPLAFDIRMATATQGGKGKGKGKDKPAVKLHGHARAATIEIIRPKERSAGGADLRLTIDEVRWGKSDGETRRALLHHETSHIVPRYDKDSGSLLLDPYGRPVVKLKPDDWMLTGFVETVRVFGEKAMERRALNCVEESLSQTSFKFDEDDADRVNDHLAAVEREADGKDDGDTTPDTSRTGWDLVTSHPLSGEQRARADELAAMESEGRGGGDKRRKRKSTPVEAL